MTFPYLRDLCLFAEVPSKMDQNDANKKGYRIQQSIFRKKSTSTGSQDSGNSIKFVFDIYFSVATLLSR